MTESNPLDRLHGLTDLQVAFAYSTVQSDITKSHHKIRKLNAEKNAVTRLGTLLGKEWSEPALVLLEEDIQKEEELREALGLMKDELQKIINSRKLNKQRRRKHSFGVSR